MSGVKTTIRNRIAALLVVCILSVIPLESEALLAAEQASWRSALYPKTWTPGYTDSEGRFLHDYSYAGYAKGERPIPDAIPGVHVDVTQAPYLADATGENDATAAIQQAIDAVGQAGGGVVYLPPGTYRIKPQEDHAYSLHIANSGVVLRGAGFDQTFLFNDEINMRAKSIVLVRPSIGDWYEPVTEAVYATADIPSESMVLPLEDVDDLSVGDWVVVASSVTDGFLAEHGMVGYWTTALRGPAFYRQITAIDYVNQVVTIDVPTRYPLQVRDQARVYKVAPHLAEVGIEDLSIGNRENPKAGWRSNDFSVPGTGAYEAHNSNAVLLVHVVDSWIRRVHSYRPAVNAADHHLLSNGLKTLRTRGVTITDTVMSSPQSITEGGNGYLYTTGGNEGLIQHSSAYYGRHNFSFQHMAASGNVLYRNLSVDPVKVSDFHNFLSMGNLFDQMTLYNDTIESVFRPHGSSLIHGQTGTQNTFWNTVSNGGLPGYLRNIAIDSRQYGHGYLIGTSGTTPAVKTTPTLMNGVETAPEDWAEGIGFGQTLEPQSLYADQLNRRTGLQPAAPIEPEAGVQTRFEIIEDTYLFGGAPDTNYGNAVNLVLKGDANTAYVRQVLMKADVTGRQSNAPTRLRVYNATPVAETAVRVWGLHDHEWSESEATWQTAPLMAGRVLIGSLTIKETGWYDIDVTDYLNDAGVEETASFLLEVQTPSAAYIRLHAREQSSHQPHLAVTMVDGERPIWPVRPVLTASQTMQSQLTINWPTASDDIAVAGYEIYKDDEQVAVVGADVQRYQITGLAPATSYVFAVRAFDAADNRSGLLQAQFRTSDDDGRFMMTDHVYVTGGQFANDNFGGVGAGANLAVKSDHNNKSYERRTYLQLNLADYNDTGAGTATLHLYKNTATASVTMSVYGVTDNGWTSDTLTWNTQPAEESFVYLGEMATSASGWYTLDVTAFVNGRLLVDSIASFLLTGPPHTVSPYISLASTQHPEHYPHLLLE